MLKRKLKKTDCEGEQCTLELMRCILRDCSVICVKEPGLNVAMECGASFEL
jgi:hypothetical protein